MIKRTTKLTKKAVQQAVSECTTVAVDLAKHVFQVAGENALGEVIYEARLRSREAFSAFVDALPSGLRVLLETGPGAQAWARQLQAGGRRPRILPAQRVAEHRSGAKNDRNDVYALLRAGRDRHLAEVPVKSAALLALQALHRARSGYVRRCTAIGNQIRGLLLEHGIALPKGGAAMAERAVQAIADASQPIPDDLRELIAELLAEWRHVGERSDVLEGRLTQAVRHDAVAQRLMSVRGIGPIIASALVAKHTRPERFPHARQFAAYFGVVPDQHSSGQRTRLGAMSKRGDGYLRSLAIQGAYSVLRQLKASSTQPDDGRLWRWLQRHGRKGATVRLANRNLRIAWVLMQRDETCRREMPMSH